MIVSARSVSSHKMLARASFFPTLAYNVLMERVTARNWWDRIDNQVVLGAIPFKGEAHKLVCRMCF